ncbi:hypothetical protein LX69_01526 [Breznakibacter xylanolyticus]|uniref:Uncharacterized protein n=1 Tax=Breznakibacter xylanolyticus TaxID=990 RepID=A0A2W7NAD9_9BACT|nr:hypothetical protein LX69_01526 [Breznakibacter xylanolyticus]
MPIQISTIRVGIRIFTIEKSNFKTYESGIKESFPKKTGFLFPPPTLFTFRNQKTTVMEKEKSLTAFTGRLCDRNPMSCYSMTSVGDLP